MADPVTIGVLGAVAARLIGNATDLNLCSLAASVIGARADAFAMDTYERIRARLGRADTADPLRDNDHLARGTVRAALLATLSCVDRVLEGEDADALSAGNSKAPKALKKQLACLIANLESADARGGRAVNRRRFEAALAEGALLLGAPDLDEAGFEVIGRQNRPAAGKNATDADVSSFRDARTRILPGIDESVTNKVLDWGEYPASVRDHVGTAVHCGFFDLEEHWLNDFGHFYAAELRQDTNLYRIATVIHADRVDSSLSRIEASVDDANALWKTASENYEGLGERLDELNSATAQMLEALDEVRKRFALDGNDVFVRFASSGGPSAGADGDYSSFYFAREEDDFVGRDDALAQIRERLLDDPRDFAWMAVCGDAATGKSRLAFQLLEENEARWRLSGFVRSEVIRNADVSIRSGQSISDPALFVLDYAGNNPEKCASFIEKCAALARSADFPIRAVVLVRRPSDRFFSFVKNSEGLAASECQVAFDYEDKRNLDSRALMLEPLAEPEILAMMRSRMVLTAQSADPGSTPAAVRDTDDAQLLEYLDYFDSKRRPLFAAMVADALQRNALSRDSLGEGQEQARLRLFWEYLESQYMKRWRHAAESESILDRHLTFATLSTMCRGLTDAGWLRLRNDASFGEAAKVMLPANEEDLTAGEPDAYLKEGSALQAIVGSRRKSDDYPYPILEPDLIGESLLLLALGEGGERLCGENSVVARHRRKYLRDMAWVADPDGSAFFAGLVAEDFPDHARDLSWLLPTRPAKENAVARSILLRNLASVAIDAFRDRAAELRDIERVEALVERFDFNEEAPDEAVNHYAEALDGLGERVSFVINKSRLPRDRIKPVALEDPQKSGRMIFGSASAYDDPEELLPTASGVAAGDLGAVSRRSAGDDGMQAAYLKSDAATAERALVFLRKAFDVGESHIFGSRPFETRLRFAHVVRHALASVFWSNRSDPGKFGFANTPLSDDEAARRLAFADSLEARLGGDSPDEETIALAALLTHIVIYAEAGEAADRGRLVYQAICNLIDHVGFRRSDTAAQAIGFLNNYSVQLFNSVKDEEPAVARERFDDLRRRARQLAEGALELPGLRRRERRTIISAYCNVIHRVAKAFRSHKLPADEILKDGISDFISFGRTHGYDPIRAPVVDMCALFLGVAEEQGIPVGDFASDLEHIATAAGFDGMGLNDQYWTDMPYALLKFATCEPSSWPAMRKVIARMASDGGMRVRDELAGVLQSRALDGSLDAARGVDLVEIADPVDCRRPDLRLATFAAALQAGQSDWAADEIDRWWTTGDTDDDLRARVLAFNAFSIFARWQGVDDPQVRKNRSRLIRILKADGEDDGSADSKIRRVHDVAAADAAAMLARLEIAAGQPPDDWIMCTGASDG